MCVPLGVGLPLQLYMDEAKTVCPTLRRRMENLVMYFYIFQRQIFVKFILVLDVFDETPGYIVRDSSIIPFK